MQQHWLQMYHMSTKCCMLSAMPLTGWPRKLSKCCVGQVLVEQIMKAQQHISSLFHRPSNSCGEGGLGISCSQPHMLDWPVKEASISPKHVLNLERLIYPFKGNTVTKAPAGLRFPNTDTYSVSFLAVGSLCPSSVCSHHSLQTTGVNTIASHWAHSAYRWPGRWCRPPDCVDPHIPLVPVHSSLPDVVNIY